jgi:hypothetical protein
LGASAYLFSIVSVASFVSLYRFLFIFSLYFNKVDIMVDKYGQGETSVYKCRSCDYEQEIRSSGIHVSEGGSVMFFSSEDEFHCPKCDSSENDQLPSKCSGKRCPDI